MSSLSGQNASTKSLTGLSDTYSTNIVCDTFEVADEFTIDTGCIVNIPANIIPDPALSTNVALLNRNPQTFTGANTFNTGTTTFNALTVHNATLRNFQSTQAVFPGDFRMLDSTQTYLTQMYQTGTTCVIDAPFASSIIRFSTRDAANTGLINLLMEKKNHIVLQGSASEIDILGNAITINGVTTHTANTTFNANVNLPYPALLNILDTSLTRGLQIQNHNTNPALTLFRGIGNSSRFNFLSNNASGVATTNFYIYNGDTCYLQGSDGLGIGMVGSAISLDGICSFTNTTTPVITQALSLSDNSTKIATTAFIKGQNYALTSDLANYGLLAGTQTFTGVNTFDNDVNIRLYNLNITNAAGTRGIRFANNGANNGVTDITGIGVSTRYNFNTTDVAGVSTQNLWIGNGTNAVIQGAAGLGINLTGSAIDVAGVCSFTNTTTPVITQTILTADNSTKIPTTAWVNSQAYLTASALTNYMTLNTIQTVTANKTFNSVVNMNELNIPSASPVLTINSSGNIEQTSATIANNLYNTTINATTGSQLTIKGTANTAGSTIAQLGSTLQISAITNNTGATLTTLTLATRSSTNTGVVVLTGNANNITMGSNTTNINLNSTNIICNGITSFTNVTTPTITQSIALADNSTKIPTTAWVNGQGYALSSALSSYALLTPTANPQIFTGQQRFQSTTANLPISVASTTGGVTGAGGLFVATSAGQYNPIVKGNDLVLVGTGSAIDSASTKLTLTTHATSSVGIQMDIGNMTFDGGIIRQNSTFNCGYSYLATPLTVKGFYDIGYVWTIPYASFTGGAWATSAVVYNILTLAWDGTGNKRIGVWKVDVVIINTCTSAPSSSLCWNTISNVNRTINDTCVGASDLFLFGATGCQIMRMSFTINVVNLTTTYFLNSLTGGGAGLASNTASSITFTRLA